MYISILADSADSSSSLSQVEPEAVVILRRWRGPPEATLESTLTPAAGTAALFRVVFGGSLEQNAERAWATADPFGTMDWLVQSRDSQQQLWFEIGWWLKD